MHEHLLKLTLDYPRMELSPNKKHGTHWTKTKSIKDSVRDAAFLLTKQAMQGKKADNIPMQVFICFVRKDKRKPDIDNLLSASKPMLDGIAMGMGVDDRFFEIYCLSRGYTTKEPHTIIEISYCT